MGYIVDLTDDPDLMCEGRKTVDCILMNIDLPKSGNPINSELRSDILSALILHDKLCVDIYDVLHLLNLFGADDCIKLLESKSFEIYENLGPVTGAIAKDSNTYKLIIADIGDSDSRNSKISWIEEILTKISTVPINNINKGQIGKILALLVANIANTKKEFVTDILFKETSYDVQNRNVTNMFDITSTDFEAINKNDLLKILRLNHINRGLIDAQRIGSDSVIIDAWAKKFIKGKLSPAMNEHLLNSSVDIFRDKILSNKGIPDLNVLFENRIINADDIIAFRETTDGKLFRKWISGIDYDPEAIMTTLLNKKHQSLIDRIVKTVRFVFPIVVGLQNPLAGIGASLVDSYIVQKIIEGWHPSLFLDNKFKSKIDENIRLVEKQKKLEILQKINKIGRNDPCSCGSGKKFRKCCGR